MQTIAPRVLVTASRENAAVEYLEALREAGAEPLRVEPGDAAMRSLDDAEALLVTGGVDVDPAAYGAAASPFVTETQPERDVFEIELLQQARARALPTLCICRGLQIANVAFGGTLIADIPQHLAERASIPHERIDSDGRGDRSIFSDHVVRIDADSALARIVGTVSLATGARHHQAAERVADDLRAVAWTDDGIIEALEARFASPFWLAVQWHPESTRALDDGASKSIFSAFVLAAQAARGALPG